MNPMDLKRGIDLRGGRSGLRPRTAFADDGVPSTVAVVVSSPTTSPVFDATSRTICAPMSSNLSSSSISPVTVTPGMIVAATDVVLRQMSVPNVTRARETERALTFLLLPLRLRGVFSSSDARARE
jgi:hypothetical protein